jgi:hypothetical protein
MTSGGGTYPEAGITIGPALAFGYIAARQAAAAARWGPLATKAVQCR